MKTLYGKFISATILILICSIGIGFALVNVVYFTFTKEKVDQQNVETAQEIARVLSIEQSSLESYLQSVGKLGYQIVIIDADGNQQSFGEAFQNTMLPKEALTKVMNGKIFHGMQDFSGSYLMMGHFSNDLENTVGVPFTKSGESYGLFLRPNNKMLFSDIHTILVGFVVAIAVVSMVGVFLMTRQLIRPITQLTEATKAVSNENFHYILDISRKDEIGQLVESFYLMQQQLAHNDEARKEFISNVSHDFQSPLMNIQGYADLLQNGVSEEERVEYLAIIDQESKRLSNLTKQLLLLTSLDQAGYPLKMKEVRVDEQLKETIRKYQWRLSERDIELSYKLEEIAVIADEELLLNVWDNLLSNALKYTDSGDMIFIYCSRVGTQLKVECQDTGIGLTVEEAEQVFERFYRVDQARKKDGTGLGLAISKEIIELHGGQIEVCSMLGEGSVFTVSIPIKRA